MATGTVKWFNNAKGYGFVVSKTGSEDLFAHYSSIQMDGYKTLRAGQDVTFEVKEGPKGLHAVNICVVDDGARVEGTRVEDAQVESAQVEDGDGAQEETVEVEGVAPDGVAESEVAGEDSEPYGDEAAAAD